MKNLKKSVLCMLMAVVMVMTVTATSVIPVQDVYAASVKLNKTSLNLYTRTMVRLTVLNTGAKAKWSSSKPKVASVTSEGYVTATYLGKKYTAKVTVISCTTSGTSVIRRKAPLADSGVLNAFDKLGFKYAYDPNVTGFTGKFSAKEHRIIVSREEDDCIYHELGHFVAWAAGNVDCQKEWKAIYDKEKSKVTFFNKGYATQNPQEYFADAYKDYVLHRSSLSSTRPETYKYVKAAVAKVNAMTSADFERMHKWYDIIWNKYGA